MSFVSYDKRREEELRRSAGDKAHRHRKSSPSALEGVTPVEEPPGTAVAGDESSKESQDAKDDRVSPVRGDFDTVP